MSACSRCGQRDPNPGCYVCWEDKASRDADRGDYLRDEMLDRQMEDDRDAFAAAKDGRFGDWHADDVGPDMDDFIKPAGEALI